LKKVGSCELAVGSGLKVTLVNYFIEPMRAKARQKSGPWCFACGVEAFFCFDVIHQ